jgi:hypothetical protein
MLRLEIDFADSLHVLRAGFDAVDGAAPGIEVP